MQHGEGEAGGSGLRVSCTRKLAWDAAHRVTRHESKCSTLHGHRYTAEITCSADALDAAGRVIDFGLVKGRVGTWIDDHWDHTALLLDGDPLLPVLEREAADDARKRAPWPMPAEPTAENIAVELFHVAVDLLEREGLRVEKVRVWETPNCWADAIRDER